MACALHLSNLIRLQSEAANVADVKSPLQGAWRAPRQDKDCLTGSHGRSIKGNPKDSPSRLMRVENTMNTAVRLADILRGAPGNCWLALNEDETRVVGSGKTPGDAIAAARTAGVDDPILVWAPDTWAVRVS